LGGGISISLHQRGAIVDVNNCAWGEGPFTPERPGSLPTRQLVELCFCGEFTEEEIMRMIKGGGGVKAYLGTADIKVVENMYVSGDKKAILVLRAMAYQVAKEIGAYFVAADYDVDAIVITGGLAHSKLMVDLISQKISKLAKLAPIEICPGEYEAEALVTGALSVLRGEVEPVVYGITPAPDESAYVFERKKYRGRLW